MLEGILLMPTNGEDVWPRILQGAYKEQSAM